MTAEPRRQPVVLVPGAFGQDLLYWNAVRHFLEHDGHDVHTLTFPRFTLTDLTVSARYLEERVQEIAEETGERVHLVAHSMGGLISRQFLQERNGKAHVESLACLGVPHHGTWAGLTAPVLKGCRQVLPGSDFLKRLNDPQRARLDVPVTNLWSILDVIVLPATHARLRVPGVENHCVKHAGHWAMLVSPWVYYRVRRAIDRAEGVTPPPRRTRSDALPNLSPAGPADSATV